MQTKFTNLLNFRSSVLVLSALVIFALFAACGQSTSGRLDIDEVKDVLNETIDILESNYVEPERVVREELNRSAIEGFLTGVLNQYAGFLDGATEVNQENLQRYVALVEDQLTTDDAGDIVETLYSNLQAENPAIGGFVTDTEALIGSTVRQLLASLNDPYTSYLTPAGVIRFAETLEGTYGGIGAYVGTDDEGQVYIISFLSQSPAREAGLMSSDVIVAVNGESVENLSQTDIAARLRGEAGTEVDIGVRRANSNSNDTELFTLTVERRRITLDIVTTELISTAEGKFGRLSIMAFNELTPALTEQGLCELIADQNCDDYCSENDCIGDLDGLILDLRGNRGGLLTETVSTASLFIDRNGLPAVFQSNSDDSFTDLDISGNVKYPDIPIVLLVDQNSASGAEVFAGALRDYGRAFISGETTFGKGSVNRSFGLDNGGAVYLTIRRWYTPCGDLIEGEGIMPRFEYTMPNEAIQLFDQNNTLTARCDDFNWNQ